MIIAIVCSVRSHGLFCIVPVGTSRTVALAGRFVDVQYPCESASQCLGLQEMTIKLNRIMKQLEANQAALQSLQEALQPNTMSNGSVSANS